MVKQCPNRSDLESLMLGCASDSDVTGWESHLEHCGACLETVRSLRTNDSVVDALRTTGGSAFSTLDVSKDALLQRLRGMYSARTVGFVKATLEVGTLLEPAQNPDELGRLGVY